MRQESMSPFVKTIHKVLLSRHGDPYASTKVQEVVGMSDGNAVAWVATELDPFNQRALFAHLGIQEDANHTATSTLRRLFAAIRSLTN